MATKENRGLAAEWLSLHGYPLPAAASELAPNAAEELAGTRPEAFLEQPNVFEAAITAGEGWRRLLLWEPFVSVLPMHALGNGDVLHVHVPSPTQQGARPAIVVWDHERDIIDLALGHPDRLEANDDGTRHRRAVEGRGDAYERGVVGVVIRVVAAACDFFVGCLFVRFRLGRIGRVARVVGRRRRGVEVGRSAVHLRAAGG